MRLFHNAGILDARGRFTRGAVLVSRGRIAGVLAPGAAAELYGREGVETVDAGRGYIVPGFADAHFHLRALAVKGLRCDLSAVRSAEELASALEKFAAADAGADPVVGVDWDESRWSDPAPPTRWRLEGIAGERGVFARRVCGHAGVVNTTMLRMLAAAGLKRYIDEDSGVVTEHAVWEANRLAAPARRRVVAAYPHAVSALHALGVTTIHDIVIPDTAAVAAEGLAASPPLHVDALVVGTVEDLEAVARDWRGGKRLRAAGIKLFADGSLGARTAALREPYADAPARGELLLDGVALRAAFERAAAAGVACAVHAIGDRAVEAVVSAFEDLGGGVALRIEHAEVLDPPLIERIAGAGIALVVQPNFARNWGGEGGLYRRRLGAARWAMTNPLRALERSGARVAFGSDGMPPGPLYGLRGAVCHPVPGQSMSAASALECYTAGPCRLEGHTRAAGRLEAGAEADFVVLSGNPFLADADTLAVTATVVAGEVVHTAGNS